MTTTSLYQKYRPDEFEKIIGQDAIVNTIKAQIDSDSIGHAYLFYGSRGLGKTTVARLMAKALGINDEDLYEIDAASNRGIDDVREIREGVLSKPFSSPYKLYIIDEVHMLTKPAFNALLKTLEEPPKYVIFVLATTELHQVPDTIKSRTQLYTFARPTTDDIALLLQRVAKAEGFIIDPPALDSLVTRSAGSYRDALTELQQYAASPSNYLLIADDSNLVADIITWFSASTDDIASNKEVIFSQVYKHPDHQVLYKSLLKETSDQLYQKITNVDSTIQVRAKHLVVLLEARSYFTDQANQIANQAGMLLVLQGLSELS